MTLDKLTSVAHIECRTQRIRLAVERIAAILKQRFPNLTVEETLRLAFDIVEAIETVEETLRLAFDIVEAIEAE
jgi:hypothetical protein